MKPGRIALIPGMLVLRVLAPGCITQEKKGIYRKYPYFRLVERSYGSQYCVVSGCISPVHKPD